MCMIVCTHVLYIYIYIYIHAQNHVGVKNLIPARIGSGRPRGRRKRLGLMPRATSGWDTTHIKTEPDPGLVAAGFVSDTIASSAEAGNEGGLLKCLFIVRSRFDVCKILAAQDMGDLQKRLHDCGCEVGAVVDSADVQALSGNDWARTRTHSDPC